MSPRWISGMSFIFIVGSMLSLLLEGAYIGDTEISVLNALTGYSVIEAGGLLAIPKLAGGFFTVGLPKLLLWDYAFFSGGFAWVRLLFMPLSIAVVWGIIQVFIAVAQGLLSRFF